MIHAKQSYEEFGKGHFVEPLPAGVKLVNCTNGSYVVGIKVCTGQPSIF